MEVVVIMDDTVKNGIIQYIKGKRHVLVDGQLHACKLMKYRRGIE